MGIESAMVRPPRCVLVNVTTGESMECLSNPAQLCESVQVQYSRLTVPGLSHQVLQFQSTGNRKFSGLEFYMDRLFAAEQPGAPDILRFRSFLQSLTVPPGGTQTVAQTAPPRALIIWPQVLTVEAVLTDLEFCYEKLSADGSVMAYMASCSFEEILDARRTGETAMDVMGPPSPEVA